MWQGQGMTSGIAGAELLCRATQARLGSAGRSKEEQRGALRGLPAAFHTELGAFLDFPWNMSSGMDAQSALASHCLLYAAPVPAVFCSSLAHSFQETASGRF